MSGSDDLLRIDYLDELLIRWILSLEGIHSELDAYGAVTYYCIPCRTRGMKYLTSHLNSPQHRTFLTQCLPQQSQPHIRDVPWQPMMPLHQSSNYMEDQQYHDQDVQMFMIEQGMRQSINAEVEDKGEGEIILMARGAFAGNSDDSDEEVIQFNQNTNLIHLISQELFPDETLPHDTSEQVDVLVTRNSEWFPFKTKEVCP